MFDQLNILVRSSNAGNYTLNLIDIYFLELIKHALSHTFLLYFITQIQKTRLNIDIYSYNYTSSKESFALATLSSFAFSLATT